MIHGLHGSLITVTLEAFSDHPSRTTSCLLLWGMARGSRQTRVRWSVSSEQWMGPGAIVALSASRPSRVGQGSLNWGLSPEPEWRRLGGSGEVGCTVPRGKGQGLGCSRTWREEEERQRDRGRREGRRARTLARRGPGRGRLAVPARCLCSHTGPPAAPGLPRSLLVGGQFSLASRGGAWAGTAPWRQFFICSLLPLWPRKRAAEPWPPAAWRLCKVRRGGRKKQTLSIIHSG